MKTKTAIKNMRKIVERLYENDGRIETEGAGLYDAYQFTEVYCFGSFAKGYDDPNDLDILFEGHGIEPNNKFSWNFAEIVALKALRKGMKKVSFHHLHIDGDFEDINKTRIKVFPSFHMDLD